MEQIKEGKENAFPHIELDTYSGKPCNQHFGLTKRELFAAMAMQGIIHSEKDYVSQIFNPNIHCAIGSSDIAQISIELADALINELNKE